MKRGPAGYCLIHLRYNQTGKNQNVNGVNAVIISGLYNNLFSSIRLLIIITLLNILRIEGRVYTCQVFIFLQGNDHQTIKLIVRTVKGSMI